MRQCDIPREIMIGESLWQVRFVRCIRGNENDLGLCDYNEHTIYIRQCQTEKERLDTLIHEMVHSIEFEFGIELKHPHVWRLAEGFTSILLENFL